MIFATVEVSPVGSKPPVAVVVRISKDGRHDLGDAAPFSTKTSSPQGRAGGWSSGRVQPRLQSSYPHASLEMQWQRPPCARESSCLRARLPP